VELFVFNGLTAFSFRRIRGLRCSDQKSAPHVMPANAGIQPCVAEILDSRLRGNDKDRCPDDLDIITVISEYVDYFLYILFSIVKVGGLILAVVRLIPLFPARAP
jgi:hypothetical protein